MVQTRHPLQVLGKRLCLRHVFAFGHRVPLDAPLFLAVFEQLVPVGVADPRFAVSLHPANLTSSARHVDPQPSNIEVWYRVRRDDPRGVRDSKTVNAFVHIGELLAADSDRHLGQRPVIEPRSYPQASEGLQPTPRFPEEVPRWSQGRQQLNYFVSCHAARPFLRNSDSIRRQSSTKRSTAQASNRTFLPSLMLGKCGRLRLAATSSAVSRRCDECPLPTGVSAP